MRESVGETPAELANRPYEAEKQPAGEGDQGDLGGNQRTENKLVTPAFRSPGKEQERFFHLSCSLLARTESVIRVRG
jgi:hypothetical protein